MTNETTVITLAHGVTAYIRGDHALLHQRVSAGYALWCKVDMSATRQAEWYVPLRP